MRNKKWVRLLAYVTGSVNQELLLQNEYLAAENRILRDSVSAAAFHSREFECRIWQSEGTSGPIIRERPGRGSSMRQRRRKSWRVWSVSTVLLLMLIVLGG